MCTIVAVFGVRSDYPLVLATNRDEFYARPTTGAVRLLSEPPTVGGRDLSAGGTWMGVTKAGLFVGVTNQRGAAPSPGSGLLSRGQLVLDALALGSPAAVTAHLCGIDARAYSAFNLMWGDANELHVAYGRSDQRALRIVDVPKGVHVLPNDELDSRDFAKVERAKALIGDSASKSADELQQALETMLGDRARPSLESLAGATEARQLPPALLRELAALCVRTPTYGTRSSTVVMIGPEGVGRFAYADGPPDQTAFEDVTPLYV